MSKKELLKVEVIGRLAKGEWTQKKASFELEMSVRQVRRMLRRYRQEGSRGLAHQGRGKESKRKASSEIREQALKLIRCNYADFGPTLAQEMLVERHSLKCSREWLRQVMIKEEIWKPRRVKKVKIYPRRQRRAREGELVQVDGSYEEWFEDRALRCCLLVMIDDATSKLQELKFVEHESTRDYLMLMRQYVGHHGLPIALYSDRHSVFKVLQGEPRDKQSQFQRAMQELGVVNPKQ